MRRRTWLTVISIGLCLGVLSALLQWGQYRFVIIDYTFEVYVLLLAMVFTGVGIWAGRQFIRRKVEVVERKIIIEKEVPVPVVSATSREEIMLRTGLSDRETEVLQLIIAGHSNQEIADRLFVSLSTIKTHVSNIFIKLEVTRRSQAIRKARAMGL